MSNALKNIKTTNFVEGVLNSYSQIFFSNNKTLAVVLLVVSFIDPFVGIGGLISIGVTYLFCRFFGFNLAFFKDGSYGYNPLMIGMVIGVYYQLNLTMIFILILSTLLCLILTIWLAGSTAKRGLPFLSLPFLLTVWILLLTTRTFDNIALSERGIYMINDMYNYGGQFWVDLYQSLEALPLPKLVRAYFMSLGAIFFQYNMLAGILISLGLLFSSRISFSLSIVGFLTGYLFYIFVGADLSQIYYSFIGFNFILAAIALGGFFIIPNWKSYVLVIILTPVIAILISACSQVFSGLQLPIYSLPFNLIGLSILAILKYRLENKSLHVVQHQNFHPETNLYHFKHHLERYKNDTYFHIHLPFFGEWKVSQGYAGNITHKGDWSDALDFVVEDDLNNTYRMPGLEVSDYYCYDLPVLAPADGYVVEIVDDIEDNKIGGVDLENNWGNTIIIKHGDYLFSKLSHIKKGSFKVNVGDYVKKGSQLGTCGNSGRSPEPHLHFQMQSTADIGSKTLAHPLAYYIKHQDGKHSFHAFEVPDEGDVISKVATTPLLRKAYEWIPGDEMVFDVFENEVKIRQEKWQFFTDAYNQTYIYNPASKATAYYVNNGTIHYFTSYQGSKNDLLYLFVQGSYKILLGYYKQVQIKDELPITFIHQPIKKFVHDFVAPFYCYLGRTYLMQKIELDDELQTNQIQIETVVSNRSFTKSSPELNTEVIINQQGIAQLSFDLGTTKIKGICV